MVQFLKSSTPMLLRIRIQNASTTNFEIEMAENVRVLKKVRMTYFVSKITVRIMFHVRHPDWVSGTEETVI